MSEAHQGMREMNQEAEFARQREELVRQQEAARVQAEEDQFHTIAIHDQEVYDKYINNDAANDLAEMRMFGSKGREYVDPQSGEQIAGQIVQEGPNKGQRVELPSMKEQILSSPRYATAKDERKRIADQYESVAKDLLSQGLSFSQAEAVLNHMGYGTDKAGPADRIRRLTGKFITGGNSIEDAQARARKTVKNENDKFLKETLTTEQYDKWQKSIADMENARREAAERAEAARKRAEADERERQAAEKAAEAARKAAEDARRKAEEDEQPPEPGDDDGGAGDQPGGPLMPKQLPGSGTAGKDAPPLLEKGPNVPLPDPIRNSNAVIRFLRGHPSGKLTNGVKYLVGGLKREPREDREKVLAVLTDDKSTLNQKLQGLDEAGAKQTKLLLERAALAGRDLSADLENAKSLREVKKIIKDAQPTGGDAVQARMNQADTLTTGEGENRRQRFEAQGDNTISPETSRAQVRDIRAADFDTLQEWSEDEGVMSMLSPAAASALQMRLSQRERVEAAAAANAATGTEPRQGMLARRRARREAARQQREAEQPDAGLDVLNTQRDRQINIDRIRNAQGEDQAQRFRAIGAVLGSERARRVANDVGDTNLSQESRDYLEQLAREEAGTN